MTAKPKAKPAAKKAAPKRERKPRKPSKAKMTAAESVSLAAELADALKAAQSAIKTAHIPQQEKIPDHVAFWLRPENLVMIQGWARDGLNRDVISGKMGISHNTLDNWKEKYPPIKKAVSVGREAWVYILENLLLEKARNKNAAGDLGAIIFALKNYAPHKWRDRHEVMSAVSEKPQPVKIVLQYKDGRVENANDDNAAVEGATESINTKTEAEVAQ